MKILIANPFGIGDVLFTTPVISNIKSRYPDAEIAYLCNRRVAPLLEQDPRLYKIFVYEKDELKDAWQKSRCMCLKEVHHLLAQIKHEHFDSVLDFSLAGEFGFFFWLAGIKKRIGFDYKKRSTFLNKKIQLKAFKDKHVIEYYSDLLKLINIEPKEKHIRVFMSKDEEKQAKSLFEANNISTKKKIVAVIPGGGASWGRHSYRKNYPADRFAAVADELIKECNAQVLILGDKKEEAILNKVRGKMKQKPSLVKADFTLREFIAILSQCSLALCNDGGPLHVAVGLGVATVSVFGPVDEAVYGPYPSDKKHIAIKAHLECRPCYKNFKLPECKTARCLQDLAPDVIFKACKKQLELI